ncbi:ECF RNA polymerase sigma factor SigE [Streptomyces sp. RB17]|uniref:RNA polymerase sigma factor n=1 Tax=Streptomyces sp. RB17 TaxID=2585197 RepID=UPI001305C28D|nr:RNA polymerase sigma factor [Streptomyces sp. RB17]MQY34347.1 ECF RNA polymerase sigma factor SigE [Streptomyces sp. RB17]
MKKEGNASTPYDPHLLARLVEGAQRGDALAMDELLGVLAPYVGRICGPVALQDGADAAQETLITVFRGIRQLKEPAALLGWVRTIAVREALKFAGRRRRQPTVPVEWEEPPASADLHLASDLADALYRLAPEHRVVLMLRHVEGLSEQEVSALLEIPVGTVRSRLFRARRSFRSAWG